jgi:hypothetical protein
MRIASRITWDRQQRVYEARMIEFVDDPIVSGRNREDHFRSAIMYRLACIDQSIWLQRIRSLQSAYDASSLRGDQSARLGVRERRSRRWSSRCASSPTCTPTFSFQRLSRLMVNVIAHALCVCRIPRRRDAARNDETCTRRCLM